MSKLKRHALLPSQLSSSQLKPGALSLPASLGLPSHLEPPAKPALLLPAGMVGQGPLTSRCTTCRGPDSDWPCGSARLCLCRTLFHSLRISSRASRSGPHPHVATCATPVIDFLKIAPYRPGHIFVTFARAVPLIQPRSSMASVSAVSTASPSFFCSADSGSCPCF